MEVTGQMLEEYANQFFCGTVQQQQEASNLLMNWQNQQNFLEFASSFLSNQYSEHAQSLITNIILNSVAETWFRYDREFLNSFRNSLLEFAFNERHSHSVSIVLESIIANIAFNDWPDYWDNMIGTFYNYLQMNNDDISIMTLKIFTIFLKMIASSTKITLKRRAEIINLFIDHSAPIFHYFGEASEEIRIGECYLEFADAFCMIIGENEEMVQDYSNFLFNNYASIEVYSPGAFKALSTLALHSRHFEHFFKPVVELSNELMSKEMPIRPEFHEFICDYLMKVIQYLEVLITTDETANDMKMLFEITLTYAPRDVFSEKFWMLWDLVSNTISENRQCVLAQILNHIIPNILNAFFELLPCSANLSRLISQKTQTSFIFFSNLYGEQTLEFLINQQYSHSLCFALGMIEQTINQENAQVFIDKVLQIISNWPDSNELSGYSAIFFMLSRIARFFELCPMIFDYFKDLVANVLFTDVDMDFQTSALLAINHIASKAPRLFYTSAPGFIDYLFSSPEVLPRENYLRLCRILSKIAVCAPDPENRAVICEKLTQLAAVRLLSSNLEEDVPFGAEIAWSICKINTCGMVYVTQYLWNPILTAIENSADAQVFSDLVTVFPATIRSAPWGSIKKMCMKFINIIQKVNNHDEAILKSYSELCQMHRQFEDYRNSMSQIFAERMADNPTAPFFEFFRICGLNEQEEPVVVESACHSISDPSAKTSKAAVDLLKKLVNRKKNIQFIVQWREAMLHAVISAFFDQMHYPILKSLYKLLLAICRRHIEDPQLNPQLDQILYDIIADSIGDPHTTTNFIASLRFNLSSGNKEEFFQILDDFLISTGRYNPSEMKVFADSLAVRYLSKEFDQIDETAPNEDEFYQLV